MASILRKPSTGSNPTAQSVHPQGRTPAHGNVRQGPPRDFGGKDPIDFYLDDVMIHGTAESVVDQILSFGPEIGMTYLMAAPLSGRSFRLLTDKVLPRIA